MYLDGDKALFAGYVDDALSRAFTEKTNRGATDTKPVTNQKNKTTKYPQSFFHAYIFIKSAGLGFEPRKGDPKSPVLPLHHPALKHAGQE